MRGPRQAYLRKETLKKNAANQQQIERLHRSGFEQTSPARAFQVIEVVCWLEALVPEFRTLRLCKGKVTLSLMNKLWSKLACEMRLSNPRLMKHAILFSNVISDQYEYDFATTFSCVLWNVCVVGSQFSSLLTIIFYLYSNHSNDMESTTLRAILCDMQCFTTIKDDNSQVMRTSSYVAFCITLFLDTAFLDTHQRATRRVTYLFQCKEGCLCLLRIRFAC